MELIDVATQLTRWAEQYQIDDILNIANAHEALLSLKSLDLSHKRLNSIPSCLFELSSLETLNLPHNQLTQLPQEITKLTNLKVLDISWNHITHDIDFLSSEIKIKKGWNRQ
jgi:Leucine-rich repeat (LRR) protein